MQSSFKLAAVAAACALASLAHADVAFDANYENNSTYTGAQGTTASSFVNDGRVELNVNGKATNGDAFVQAKGTALLNQKGAAEVDDSWIAFGTSAADVKIGRFEHTDLFPLGKDTLVAPALDIGYRANTLRGRGVSTTNQPHFAIGVNAGAARIELGVIAQTTTGISEVYGLRPTVVFGAGPLTLRAGVESVKTSMASTATTQVADSTGLGLSVGYAFSASGSLNANYARTTTNDGTGAGDVKKSSIGVNATIGDFGIGFIQDKKEDTASVDTSTLYAAYSFPLLGVKGATITPAVSMSSGTGVENKNALRVRLNYSF